MDILLVVAKIFAVVSGFLVALLSTMLFHRVRWPAPALWFLKLYVSALSPVFLLISAISLFIGLAAGSALISMMGMYDVLIYSIHIYRLTRTPGSKVYFEQAFGLDWEYKIKEGLKNKFLTRRGLFWLPNVRDPRFEQNIPFVIIPGTDQKLLCDIWQPPPDIAPSGLAFIYLHGGAWCLLDKDFGTRPFFRHLAYQGHLIMDVAYRLAPETDMMEMVKDAKRAIGWMKENAATYGVHPDKIVIGGGSAGAHLALLAAYTEHDPSFIPPELEGKNLSVCAVLSLYGPSNLEAMYYHTNQHLTTRAFKSQKVTPDSMPSWMIKKMGKHYHRLGFDKDFETASTFAPLLGGHPDECPDTYRLFSPVNHVHAHCPPTLLLHGEHDTMAPVKSTQYLFTRLKEEKIPTVIHIMPQTDHGFDLVLPKISPSAHVAYYDIERFLGLQLSLQPDQEEITKMNNTLYSTINVTQS